jgi:hypothetical protein
MMLLAEMSALEQSGLLASLVLSMISIVGTVVLVAGKMARTELMVTELWRFRDDLATLQLRRAASELVLRGHGETNSPFKISAECRDWFAPIADELRAFYQSFKQPPSDLQLFVELDRAFGMRLLKEYFTPHGLAQTEGLLIAATVAKGAEIDLPDDKPSESGIGKA